MKPNLVYVIGHKKGELTKCWKYYGPPQLLFYTTFYKNPKFGPGPKIRVVLGPGRSLDPATMNENALQYCRSICGAISRRNRQLPPPMSDSDVCGATLTELVPPWKYKYGHVTKAWGLALSFLRRIREGVLWFLGTRSVDMPRVTSKRLLEPVDMARKY